MAFFDSLRPAPTAEDVEKRLRDTMAAAERAEAGHADAYDALRAIAAQLDDRAAREFGEATRAARIKSRIRDILGS